MSRPLMWWCIAVIVLGALAWVTFAPQPSNWTPTYKEHGTAPFDLRFLASYLEEARSLNVLQVSVSAMDTELEEYDDAVVVSLGYNRATDDSSQRSLAEFVTSGGELLMSWEYEPLLAIGDTAVGCTTVGVDGKAAVFTAQTATGTVMCIVDSIFEPAYLDFKQPELWTVMARINGHPCLAQRAVGQGSVTICSMPRLYTNAAFATPNVRPASVAVANFMPQATTLWLANEREDLASWIQHNPGISFAYNLAFVTILVYVAVASRRRQRIIPVVRKLSNSTVEFMWTVGKLYFKRHDNRNLGRKLARLLRDTLHNRLRLSPDTPHERLAEAIADSTGIDIALANTLVDDLVRYDDPNTTVSDADIIETFQRHQHFQKVARI